VTVYRTQRELDRYCYRVAGTVGLLMCALFGVDDPRALPFAVDLGLGMQLTNICRDVLEDAERGRVYLPQSVLGVDVTAERLAAREPDALARARTVVEDLLERAECFYRSADLGTPMLPARARYAVLAASRTYEAIGARIRRFPAGGLPERAYVGASGKALHVLRGVAAGALPRRGSPVHDATLHTALRGLPGADPG
ncbi:MAG: squalene/phytoene synthase family protein, partial [Planctomycetota bacterium]